MSPYHRAGALLPAYALASMLARRHLGPRLTCGELATLPCHRQADTDGFGAPRCSSFLSAPDAPIGQICARSDSVRSCRTVTGLLCAASATVLVTGDLRMRLGRARWGYSTGHACGGGCAAPLCKTPAHEGQHPGVRAVR